MRSIVFILAAAAWILLAPAAPLNAKDIVLNDGFTLMPPPYAYWTESGDPVERWIDYIDVNGVDASYCLAQWVCDGYSGGLTQEVYVIQGVTYEVSADFAYVSC